MDNLSTKTPRHYFLRVLLPSVIALIGIALLADFTSQKLIIPKSEPSEVGRLYRLVNSNGSQVPIFGSSRGRWAYNPYFMNLNAYNYCFDGTSLIGTLTFAREHCEKGTNVPVIINIDYHFWNSLGDENKLVPFCGKEKYRAALDSTKAMKYHYQIPGIRFFDIYQDYFRYSFKILYPGGDSIFNGYNYELRTPLFEPKILKASIDKSKKNPFEFKAIPYQLKVLEKLLTDYPKTTFFFIKSPYHNSFLKNAKSMKGYSEYIYMIKSHPNAVVINNVDDNSYSDSCFTDYIHSNRKGAQQFGIWLSNEFQKYPQLQPYLVKK